jgi:hypothetical protein
MMEHTLDDQNGILHVRPKGSLQQADFEQLARMVDPFIAQRGGLGGIVIETAAFPGWDSVAAMIAHFRFVRDHHKHIRKIAVVTDSPAGNIAENLVSHFVSAEIRKFPPGAADAAKEWIST